MEAISQKQDNSDTLGVLIKKIRFRVKALKDDTIFKDGIMPWIDIENPEKEIDRLLDADEIIIQPGACSLIIDYPLKNNAIFTITPGKNGMSRKDFIWLVNEKYREIYAEEEQTSHIKIIPQKERKQLLNRNQTDGKYGIWGHDLADLALNTLYIYKRANGQIFLTLDMDS
ncbi:hypothetical protein BEL04_12980 [Mucilaginibacter sp. PPCGB 2223]|uniref:hypothetical protein n=1 Tax=Mucilaginibacter sp. PPCGB 2223 TaxID=1886027 RepID=UPI0008240D39|nr:hypothetical protein [Mucilaginibacter sp. PPCGB 2223]OCX52378.1 hypothetical protein BEL04_12980 [Mucilaginibacter sp. PPCGB 2223]